MQIKMKKTTLLLLVLLRLVAFSQVTSMQFVGGPGGKVIIEGNGNPTANATEISNKVTGMGTLAALNFGSVYTDIATGDRYTYIDRAGGKWQKSTPESTDTLYVWSVREAITFTTTVTPPTKATTTQWDSVRYRFIEPSDGSKPAKVEVEYLYVAEDPTGSAAGAGTYQIELPAGLQFNSSFYEFTTASGSIPASRHSRYAIERGQVVGIVANNTSYSSLIAVPVDATHFRILLLDSSGNPVGSSNFPLTGTGYILSLLFQFYIE